MAPTPLQQGDPPQIGRYRLTARLGSGGMGVVYLGEAVAGELVAVKVLRPEYADDQEFRARFQREVSAMGRVRNRYCVRVLDADTESATPFLATEFAEGPALDEHVKASGPMHPEALYMLASALAEAISAIHAAGVTHRDLKPSNVLLTNSGPRVIDFGIAQVADTVSITRTGMAIGSPGYMAPEQVTGHAGREADIFTWALIVAYAASGQPPFGSGEAVAILHRILSDRPDITAVPPRLQQVVQAALNKDPQRRPAAADLLRELQAPGSTGIMTAPMGGGGQAGGQTTRLDAPFGGQTTRLDGQGPRGVRPNDGFEPGRTRAMAGDPGPGYYGESGYGGTGPRRNWRAPAIAAVVLVAAVAGGWMLLSGNGSGNGNNPSGVTTPTASASTPAQQAATTPADVPTTDNQQGNGNQQAPGKIKKHKAGTGGGTGTGGSGGSTPSSAPTLLPSLAPSSAAPSSAASTSGTSGQGGATPSSSASAVAGG